jgi:hypothetical protein
MSVPSQPKNTVRGEMHALSEIAARACCPFAAGRCHDETTQGLQKSNCTRHATAIVELWSSAAPMNCVRSSSSFASLE